MKDDKEIVINDSQEEVHRYSEQKQKIVLKNNMAATEKVEENSGQEGKDVSVAVKMKIQ